jgi:hypothetical protein
LALKRSVDTLETNITSRHSWLKIPPWEFHHKNVAIEARSTSTYIPAAPIAARFHLEGSIQLSDTSQ